MNTGYDPYNSADARKLEQTLPWNDADAKRLNRDAQRDAIAVLTDKAAQERHN